MVIIPQEQLVLTDNFTVGQAGAGGTSYHSKLVPSYKIIFTQGFFSLTLSMGKHFNASTVNNSSSF